MGTQDNILINTHLRLVPMGSFNSFLYHKFLLFMYCFWSSASTLFLAPFGLFIKTFFRAKGNERVTENYSGYVEFNQKNEGSCNEEIVERGNKKNNEEEEEEEEEESPKLFFKFKYQTFREDSEPIELDSTSSTSTSKYEFLAGKSLSQFLKEPEAVSLRVRELNADFEDGVIKENETSCDEVLLDKKFRDKQVGEESVGGEGKRYSIDEAEKTELESSQEATGSLEKETFWESSLDGKGKGKLDGNEENVLVDDDVLGDGDSFLSEKEFIGFGFGCDLDSGSDASRHEFVGSLLASTSEGFLTDKDFEDALVEEESEFAGIDLRELNSGYETDDFEDEDDYILQELKQFESQIEKPDDLELLGQLLQRHCMSKQQEEGCDSSEPKGNFGDTNEGESNSEKAYDWENEESNDLESLWEQQEFMEQLKMDLRKVRATGLPTILEEEEYPKIMEDFKPLKLDEKVHHEGRMSELHKFYRSYKERMRKLDILNYQKRIAMGCCQSKDPLQSISSKKDSSPSLVSLLSSKFLPCRHKISASDPLVNIIRELQSEFETVYVGQMCLSWEILHWQYQKGLELWDSDHYGMRRYNEVAGEFQQFQVLLQRFVENEPFEGPRVENYTNKRYLLRNFLQVPVIKEDRSKERKAWRKEKDDHAITSDQLIEIMEESIRIFWRFIRADKDTHNPHQKCRRVAQIEHEEDPNELELFTDVQTNLQKKEKRLRDILKKGNCVWRKFQKQEEENSDHVLYFFSQVDMKLVSRVLNMSKITTDQLLWCRNKLNKINFVGRKIHVEPSFCLFPS